MKRRDRHWFHCSSVDRGERFVAERRLPFAGRDEPRVPRLCVGPTVARCFAARLLFGDVSVYRTESPRRGVKPYRVWDQLITQEHWLVPPVQMVRVAVVPREIVNWVNGPVVEVLARERKCSARLRVEHLARAVEGLRGSDEFVSREDERFVALALPYFRDRYPA